MKAKPVNVAMAVVGAALLLALVTCRPVVFRPDGAGSPSHNPKHVDGDRVKISELLGTVDVVCAVHPSTGFGVYKHILTRHKIEAADAALRQQNKVPGRVVRTFVAGFRGDELASVYASDYSSEQKRCVEGNAGYIVFHPLGDSIAFELEGIPANTVID